MEAFFQKYYKYLHNYFKNKVGHDNPEAEDLAMEVIMKAWNNLPSFEGKSTEPHWVFCIAANRFRDYLRRKKKINFVSLGITVVPTNGNSEWSDEDYRFADSAPSPEEELERKERIEIIAKIIRSLRPDHQNVIKLFYNDGLQVEEMAEQLNIPVGTVKSRLFRARVKVAQKLKELGAEGIF